MRDIVPIDRMTRRIPEGGRIRIGKKKGNRPTSIDTFRFTSQDHDAITQIAGHYGGRVEEWKDGYGVQWQVETDTAEVRVVLPPEPISAHYELWSGGGCQRRCDGVTAEVPGTDEMMSTPCICDAQQEMACKPKVRLNVILPDVKFGGVWRLETSSWNAAQELPGMVDTIMAIQDGGMVRGLLALEKRQSKSGGRTRNFVVPTLRLDTSVDEVLVGMASVARLSAPQHDMPALGASSPGADEGTPEAPVARASGDSPPPTEEPDAPDVAGEAASGGVRRAALTRAAHAAFKGYGWDYESQVRPALEAVYEGRTLSKLEDAEVSKLLDLLAEDDSRARFEEHMPYVVEEAEVVE